MHHITTVLFLFLLAGIAIAHYCALEWYIYWLYPWFDILMHFWGGAVVAVGALTPVFSSCTRIRVASLGVALLIVLGVGIAWEVFEWYFVIVDSHDYLEDTVLDLIMDLGGGAIGFLLARWLQPKQYIA